MTRINTRQWRPLGVKRPSEAMQAISEKNATESPFLALPPEIRNRIYRLALGDKTIHIWTSYPHMRIHHTTCLDQDFDDRKLKLPPRSSSTSLYTSEEREKLCDHCTTNLVPLPMQLLQTCRQVYTEAALIPFANNDFRITSTSLEAFEKWMSSFQKKSIEALTVICARGRGSFPKKAVQKFSNLKTLKIVALESYSVGVSDIECFSGLPLRDVSIIELRDGDGDGEYQSFDHQALRARLIDAGEERKALEPVRRAQEKERAAKTKEYRKNVSKAYDEEVLQAVQSGSARALRAKQRKRHRGTGN